MCLLYFTLYNFIYFLKSIYKIFLQKDNEMRIKCPSPFKWILIPVLFLQIGFAGTYGDITIDGDLSEWKITDRVNIPKNVPPTLANDKILYARYSDTPEPTYIFALKSPVEIGADTTFWLNTDKNENTGYKIWGTYGGEEFYVNIYTDGKPYLYDGEPFGTYIGEIEDYAYNDDKSVLEFAIPASMIEYPQEGVNLLVDINDQIFLPQYYSEGEYEISNDPVTLPQRSDFSKRVAIVYSETTKNHFFDVNLPIQKAYSQLFMAMQYQCMMAGIPFDLLTEDDLTDVTNIKDYDALIFPYFAYVPESKFDEIYNTLFLAQYYYHIPIITAGDFMTNYDDGSPVEGDAYGHMKQLLGIGRVDGDGPVSITLKAADTSNPAMKDYASKETIIRYDYNHWYNYFEPVSYESKVQPTDTLATQTVSGDKAGTYDAVLAVTTGARNVHFSTIEYMGDTNLLWSILQWSVYGDEEPVALKMGRFKNLFISRNDMDQSQEIDEVEKVDGALLYLLEDWKSKYNFVGSYFINIGNNPPDQQTDWSYSEPLYRAYIDLGNEIGTHSYTHPHDTNVLSDEEIRFEFDESMDIIAAHLNPTWRDESVRGGAVPGAPESLDTALKIMQYLDYLTGGYSGVGAGYPGAFGYLTPYTTKVYFSPNMSFDFTLIEYGVPVWNEETQSWDHIPLTPDEAEQYWQDEYHSITKHASLPIIHWPWHDYGPTTGVTEEGKYSLEMFENLIKTAYYDDSEFLTSIDAAFRIESFKNSSVSVERVSQDTIEIEVNGYDLGKFALNLNTEGKVISSVDGWYAYNENSVFLDEDGGTFRVNLGTSPQSVTHITSLPMRASLIWLEGDGRNLSFQFKGEGKVIVSLAGNKENYTVTGADRTRAFHRHKRGIKHGRSSSNILELFFDTYGVHTVSITEN